MQEIEYQTGCPTVESDENVHFVFKIGPQIGHCWKNIPDAPGRSLCARFFLFIYGQAEGERRHSAEKARRQSSKAEFSSTRLRVFVTPENAYYVVLEDFDFDPKQLANFPAQSCHVPPDLRQARQQYEMLPSALRNLFGEYIAPRELARVAAVSTETSKPQKCHSLEFPEYLTTGWVRQVAKCKTIERLSLPGLEDYFVRQWLYEDPTFPAFSGLKVNQIEIANCTTLTQLEKFLPVAPESSQIFLKCLSVYFDEDLAVLNRKFDEGIINVDKMEIKSHVDYPSVLSRLTSARFLAQSPRQLYLETLDKNTLGPSVMPAVKALWIKAIGAVSNIEMRETMHSISVFLPHVHELKLDLKSFQKIPAEEQILTIERVEIDNVWGVPTNEFSAALYAFPSLRVLVVSFGGSEDIKKRADSIIKRVIQSSALVERIEFLLNTWQKRHADRVNVQPATLRGVDVKFIV
jgi:hypothetical protein